MIRTSIASAMSLSMSLSMSVSLSVSLALVLASCGGGTASGALSTPASIDATTAPASIAAPSSTRKTIAANAQRDTWTDCAVENGNCAFTDLRTVRYGTPDRFVERDLVGSVHCDNATFGDPAIGIVKSCAYSSSAWTNCAVEGGRCGFDGTRTVRYGTVARYTSKEESGGSACINEVFGDPIVGSVKACWIDTRSGGVTTPAPDVCEVLPALPHLPASYNVVTSFCVDGRCAKPDDDTDDTDAIDKAIDASEGKFLVFPPGRYLIKRSLRIKKAGVTLWGPGATIHATNPDDQSIIVEADNASIYSFRLTAVTAQRGGRAEHTRIAIYGPAGVNPVVRHTVIRDNQIVNAGGPGTDLANASTGAGIFVNAADGFLIAGNTVARSLADGIHITGGARNGRVLENTVRETGDDMIAMVSYAYPDPYANVAATIGANFPASLERYRDRNILVANNRLSGPYWGRGIAVVGGRDITIRGNTLSNVPYAAAVLLAREPQSGSFGVDNVVVENNTIVDEQTSSPPYDFGGKFASHGRTGHGAVEVEAAMFVDELAFPAMVDGFAVKNLAIRNNTITNSATSGVRVGIGSGGNWGVGPRAVTGGPVPGNVSMVGNAMSGVRSSLPIQIVGGDATCLSNTNGGNGFDAPQCRAAPARVAVTGASLSCPGT